MITQFSGAIGPITATPETRSVYHKAMAKWVLQYGWSPNAEIRMMRSLLNAKVIGPDDIGSTAKDTEGDPVDESTETIKPAIAGPSSARHVRVMTCIPQPALADVLAVHIDTIVAGTPYTLYQVATVDNTYRYPLGKNDVGLPYVPPIAEHATSACRQLIKDATQIPDSEMLHVACAKAWLEAGGHEYMELVWGEFEEAIRTGEVIIPRPKKEIASDAGYKYDETETGLVLLSPVIAEFNKNRAAARDASETDRDMLDEINRSLGEKTTTAVATLICRATAAMLSALQAQYAFDRRAGNAMCLWLHAYAATWKAHLHRAQEDVAPPRTIVTASWPTSPTSGGIR